MAKEIKLTRDKLCIDNDIQFNCNLSQLSDSEFRQKSVVDDFYSEKFVDVETGDDVSAYSDPIFVLFNQQRLNSLGVQTAADLLSSFVQKQPSLQQLKSQCSDAELISLIKSRHIQQPSELIAWSDYMASNIEKFNQSLAEIRAQRESSQIVEPPKTE